MPKPGLAAIRIVLALVAATFAIGCADVPAYQRGALAHPTMSASDVAGPAESHVRSVHEGATGGASASAVAADAADARGRDRPGGPARLRLERHPRRARAQSPYVARASSETAGYGDTDHVFVLTPSVAASVEKPSAGWSLDASYLVDVISAASVDIVSTASRRWTEVRQAGTVGGSYQLGPLGISGAGVASVEPDYTSLAGGLVLSQDLRAKNLTLFAGYEHGHDVAGRTGTPFSVFSRAIDLDDLKAGLTFVLDRATLATALAEADLVNGDTSKPYRYVALFAPGTPVPRGASIDLVNSLRLSERAIEQVPLTRARYSLTFRVAHRFLAATLRRAERVSDDTGGLIAATPDVRGLGAASRRLELGPHARLHAQTSVDFWQLAYVVRPGFDYPAYRTGDRELGPLVELTFGGSLRVGVGPASAPMKWALGLDLNATYTRATSDDLYVTERIATLGRGLRSRGSYEARAPPVDGALRVSGAVVRLVLRPGARRRGRRARRRDPRHSSGAAPPLGPTLPPLPRRRSR